jgi:sec-independent protein translocase protein TatA
MSTIGIYGLLVIAAVVVLIFGSRWLPSWGRSLGQGMRGFTKELTTSLKGEEEEEDERERAEPASSTAETTDVPAPPPDKQRVSS